MWLSDTTTAAACISCSPEGYVLCKCASTTPQGQVREDELRELRMCCAMGMDTAHTMANAGANVSGVLHALGEALKPQSR